MPPFAKLFVLSINFASHCFIPLNEEEPIHLNRSRLYCKFLIIHDFPIPQHVLSVCGNTWDAGGLQA